MKRRGWRRRADSGEVGCLSLLASATSLPKLLQSVAFLLKSGLGANPLLLTKLVSSSSVAGAAALSLAVAFFSSSAIPPDPFLLNTLIRSHAVSPLQAARRRAVSYFSLLLRLGLHPNKFTFPFLLKACAALNSSAAACQSHAAAVKFGFAGDPYVQNTLVHVYSCVKGGDLHDARKVFDASPKASAASWSAMIGGCVRWGRSDEAIKLFRGMQEMGVKPDDVTVIAVLAACAGLGALELARWLEKFMEREGIPKTVPLCNALIDTLAKCGDVDSALKVFEGMKERTVVSWTSVIDGLAMYGRGEEALKVFEEMREEGMQPDDVAFIGVLTACSHAGMVDEGCRYFELMKRDYGIKPKVEHYGCLVDMFSRAGLIERAVDFVRRMPIKPNAVIWRSLISACRAHGRLELGESITKDLLARDPDHGSNYIILGNVYALTRRWEQKHKIRKAMSRRGILKVPGCSVVELDGEIHEFIAGDESHPQFKEMYGMIEEMAQELRRAGHIAATSEVLLDVDEEDKEGTLLWHSEKMAIAFVLLRTPPGTQIRVVKNLRVCADCHAAIKCISKIYEREIVVRDRSRFHIFSEGACSCKDFW